MMSGDDPLRTETWGKLTKSFEMFDRFEAAFKDLRVGGGKSSTIKPLIRTEFDTGKYSDMKEFDPVILPVDARVEVNGMLPQEIMVFKSKVARTHTTHRPSTVDGATAARLCDCGRIWLSSCCCRHTDAPDWDPLHHHYPRRRAV